MTLGSDPASIIKSKDYVRLMILAAVIGVPVSAAAFGFLQLVSLLQKEIYIHLPNGLGFDGMPVWWPVPILAVAGLCTAAAIRYLPGNGGHSPADGFSAGQTLPEYLPGVILAALASLSLGVVIGPEAPLIALGSGLGMLAIRLVRRDTPATTQAVVAAAGSFAAISTIFGSPIIAAFFLMEAVGMGGGMLSVVLLPGLLAAGVGSLIFLGLGTWTGLGTLSLTLPGLPPYAHPHASELAWALAIGVAAGVVGWLLRKGAVFLRSVTSRRPLLLTPVAGLAIGGLAVAFAATTHHPSTQVLFSGQNLLDPLVTQSGTWAVSALLLLLAFKGVAYAVSLSSFRGGPIFPSLLLGAAGGVALSHLPGVTVVPGVAMGMGALAAAMLRLPLSSVMLACLLMGSDGLAAAPVVIVAVVVSYLVGAHLLPNEQAVPGGGAPAPAPAPAAAPPPTPAPAGGPSAP